MDPSSWKKVKVPPGREDWGVGARGRKGISLALADPGNHRQ